jgi:hypothetical protein
MGLADGAIVWAIAVSVTPLGVMPLRPIIPTDNATLYVQNFVCHLCLFNIGLMVIIGFGGKISLFDEIQYIVR